ncbi:MAG: hypothetical protein R2699_10495 [Acidimicrobiales bacterium]
MSRRSRCSTPVAGGLPAASRLRPASVSTPVATTTATLCPAAITVPS